MTTALDKFDLAKRINLWSQGYWEIPEGLDTSEFDFEWKPDPYDRPYIHQFGTQWQKTGGPRFVIPDAEGIKYHDFQQAKRLPDAKKFRVLINAAVDFDWSWHPDDTEPPFIWTFGNQYLSSEQMPTVEYHVPGATDRKFVNDQVVRLVSTPENWRVNANINREKFDFDWAPHPWDPPYIYVWGNQFLSGQEMPTVEYHAPGATDRKYMTDQTAMLTTDPKGWKVNMEIRPESFDFDWAPHPWDPPYIYVWGNQHLSAQECPTVEYHVLDATERKYMTEPTPVLANDSKNWIVCVPIVKDSFDFTWAPHPWDPPYIYVWGNQWLSGQEMPTVEYHVPGATERKYMSDNPPRLLNKKSYWRVMYPVDRGSFDFDWAPHPWDPPYIYVWGNQWYDAETMPTIEYHMPGATERKYMSDGAVNLLPTHANWIKNFDSIIDFDYSWRPDPRDPPYIYIWGNQYNSAEIEPTLEYHVPGATDFKYMSDKRVKLSNSENPAWKIYIDGAQFDFDWRPDPHSPPYIYTWGNQWNPGEVEPTVEYHVPGATERKYMSDVVMVPGNQNEFKVLIPGATIDWSWRPDPTSPPYIYTWGNQWNSSEVEPTVEYHVPGATERKYMTNEVAIIPENKSAFKVLISGATIDYSWRPDPTSPPYIYTWGNKWNSAEVEPTVEYHVPGATERKYMTNEVAILPENKSAFKMLMPGTEFDNIDYSWRPDPTSPPYIYTWGNQWNSSEVEPTIEYHVPGATQRKYMKNAVGRVPESRNNWRILVKDANIDWSWRPDPTSPPYIYTWGNQWNPGEVEPTIEYIVPGATERKYMKYPVVTVPESVPNWNVLVPGSKIDWSWRPNPLAPPYIYVFGNQWYDAVTYPTLEYHVPGATQHSYVDDIKAVLPESTNHWKILIQGAKFDFTWRPDPTSPPYIYVWGTKWNSPELEPAIEYHVPGATDRKYMHDRVVDFGETNPNWQVLIPGAMFDDSWRPDPREPDFIYVWGNQWNSAEIEPTVEYHVPGATTRKYMSDWIAVLPATQENWSISDKSDLETFDFSWRPNPHSPPQIYQWENNGPTYTVPGATDVVLMERDSRICLREVPRYYISTTLDDLVREHPDEVFWAINSRLDYDSFDFSWKPNAYNFKHINVFGNKLSRDTQTYYVNGPMYTLGHRQFNYITTQELTQDNDLEITQRVILDMFYVDVGNGDDTERFEALKVRFPNVQRTRFLNSWRDTINRCLKKSATKFVWILNSRTDYSEFEFDWYPADWQFNMLHVFGTQWSHWGNTYLVNAGTFEEDSKYIEVIEHLRNINHVKNKRIPVSGCAHDMLYIDMGNSENASVKQCLQGISKRIYEVKYTGTYLDTLRTWLKDNSALASKRDYCIWITNSIADYKNFDWSWHPDPFQREQIHVFGTQISNSKQKFGDTLFVNVSELARCIDDLDQLENYAKKVNYVTHITSGRLQHPVITHTMDSHVDALKQIHLREWPYYELVNFDSAPERLPVLVPSVWGGSHETVIVSTTGASQIIVPDRALDVIQEEIYDYNLIDKSAATVNSKLLDIVFISNGEPVAEDNYNHLVECCRRKGVKNRIVRIKNVDGRVNSQHAAARASNTAWYFLVNGKVRVREDFDWSWQPDRLQQAKHYIFTVTNPVNGLEYGHQAIVANNRDLTLKTVVRGLDFTLDSLHEVVNVNCGVAIYNTDAWTTWRTAFRESIKLRNTGDTESRTRLEKWLTQGAGEYAEWSQLGAQDGVAFWESVNGDMEKLMQSYDWAWILNYYERKYGK